MKSWVDSAQDSDFSIYNLPFGVFSTTKSTRKRIGIAIGDQILDLYKLSKTSFLEDLDFNLQTLRAETLNPFIGEGNAVWARLRARVQSLLRRDLTSDEEKKELKRCLTPQSSATMHLPVKIGDYTDFYSSEAHATNVGKMFRDPANALLPNWKHLPVAYHGRASSIKVSGTPFHRPKGQIKPDENAPPQYAATRSLDFELEMAFIVGKPNEMGCPITTSEAENHIFGFVIFNDWSARDIQKWEYVPLGPFLAKNFFSSMSAWIVPLAALEPFRTEGPTEQLPTPLDYLKSEGKRYFDVDLTVKIAPKDGDETVISQSNFKNLYWNPSQQLAHHTVNGCPMEIGDLLASGTISGDEPSSFGSMLELTWGGKNPILLPDGSERRFIQDFDTITMTARAEKDGIRVGFGEVRNLVLPTR